VQIHISTQDGVPVYLQIVNQVKYLAAAGRLAPGEEMPSVRAYLELERAGVVVKRHGSGTYVSEEGSPLARKERMKILTQRADALLAEAQHLDVALDDLLALLKDRHKNLNSAQR
jgi:GntR family transcriptional regulator